MSLDKFGRSSHANSKLKNLRTSSLPIPRTTDGDYDFTNHKLCNVKTPTVNDDSANKKYVDDEIYALKFYDFKEGVSLSFNNFHIELKKFIQLVESKFIHIKEEFMREDAKLTLLLKDYFAKLDLRVKQLELNCTTLKNDISVIKQKHGTFEANVIQAFNTNEQIIVGLRNTINSNNILNNAAFQGENESGSGTT